MNETTMNFDVAPLGLDAPPSERPYSYFVSYTFNEGGNSGFGQTVVACDTPIRTAEHITELQKVLEGRKGRVVILFWRSFEED